MNMSAMRNGAAHDMKRQLLYEIQAISFAKDEVSLYLDTHPDNKQALEYFYDLCDKIGDLKEKYEAEYGPLTHEGVQGDTWTWLDGAWPWQNNAEVKEG